MMAHFFNSGASSPKHRIYINNVCGGGGGVCVCGGGVSNPNLKHVEMKAFSVDKYSPKPQIKPDKCDHNPSNTR